MPAWEARSVMLMMLELLRVETKKEVPEGHEKVSQEVPRCSEIVGKLCQQGYWHSGSKMQQYDVGWVH